MPAAPVSIGGIFLEDDAFLAALDPRLNRAGGYVTAIFQRAVIYQGKEPAALKAPAINGVLVDGGVVEWLALSNAVKSIHDGFAAEDGADFYAAGLMLQAHGGYPRKMCGEGLLPPCLITQRRTTGPKL